MYYYIIIITIILIWAIQNTINNEKYLYGFWIAADDEFCNRSDIESMMVFIGEPNNNSIYLFNRTRPCYIIITDDLSNQSFSITYRPSILTPPWGPYKICVTAQFDDEMIWPERVNIDVNVIEGSMKIYDSDTIYAKLVKYHDITNAAKQANECEFV
jgi:hypothetical protein